MKRNLLLILLIAAGTFCHAQKVQFKDNKVLVNDSAILRYKKTSMLDEYSFYSLKTSDEIIHIKYARSAYGGGNTTINFPQNFCNFESGKLIYGVDSKPIIKKLVKDGVLTMDGAIDYEKVQTFRKQYETE